MPAVRRLRSNAGQCKRQVRSEMTVVGDRVELGTAGGATGDCVALTGM